MEKAKDRLEVLKRIDEYERKRWFSKDVEDDPPTITLMPDKVDYLHKKLSTKIKSKIVSDMAYSFIKKLIREKKLIIKDVVGVENYKMLEDTGAILTCNHFNAFDNFAIHTITGKGLYKVIREGNYTSFPGLYGLFFRNCNTLPLSSNFQTMKLFMEAVDVLLKKGKKILIYPEQGMWWNYRKPRPLTNGAFRFAASSNVPVIPFFIGMTDSDLIGDDGFPIQEYTIHILDPIYPVQNLSVRENAERLKEKNYAEWKECYEAFYGIPLEYLPEEAE